MYFNLGFPKFKYIRAVQAGAQADWTRITRAILEAFFHARFFLEMAVRYADLDAPHSPLPSGYAKLLYLYGLRLELRVHRAIVESAGASAGRGWAGFRGKGEEGLQARNAAATRSRVATAVTIVIQFENG